MHHYPFHPADYTLDTVHLSDMEDLAYRRLIDLYYTSEKPISLETQLVSRRLRLGSDLVIKVLKEFFVETENGWVQAKCEAVIADYHASVERARANGKLGGRPKKTQSVILANPDLTQSKPRAKLTINHKPETNNTPISPRGRKSNRIQDPEFPDDYPQGHREPLTEWFKHKQEQGKGYLPTGWKALLSKHRDQSSESLAQDISSSMSKNYQGIYADNSKNDVRPQSFQQSQRPVQRGSYQFTDTNGETYFTK